MMMAEGVARTLNPKANMWGLARPLAEKLMSSEVTFRTQARRGWPEPFVCIKLCQNCSTG